MTSIETEGKKLKFEKILATIAFIFLILELGIIALTPSATGYEISIYDAYPSYFWFILIAPIACGVVILLHQAFSEKKSNWWLVGLAIIIFSNSIFLLLPKFRGYALYGRDDELTHLGYIKDILLTGHVGEGNFYPVTHILGSILIQLTGMSLESIPLLFSILFASMYIFNIYLVAKTVTNQFGQVLLMIAFASPLIYSFFQVNFHPSIFSLFMVPCLLYCYQKKEMLPYSQHKNTVLLLLLAVLITFFHPVTTLFVIVTFFTFGLARTLHLHFRAYKRSRPDPHENVGKNFLGVSLMLLIIFSMWFLSYSYIQQSIKAVFNWLLYRVGGSLLQTTLNPLAEANLTPLQIFELFMNRYGAIFLLLLISSASLLSTLKKGLSRRRNVEAIKFIYAIAFLIAFLIGAFMLFGYFVEYNPIRVSRFALLMGTILSGMVVYDFIKREFRRNTTKRNNQRSGMLMVVAIIILVMVVLSIGSVYTSPRVSTANRQVTRMELAGIKWFEAAKNPEIAVVLNTISPVTPIRRFEDYIFGVETFPIARARVDTERLPSHFGYDEYEYIAEALNFEERYLIVFELDKVTPLYFPENVRPKVYQYTAEDFVKLTSDSTIIKLYCNGEFEVWLMYVNKEY